LPTLRFHDLRHSAVPLWVAVGANLLQVSRWLGHSTVQITADVYGHLFPETNDLAIRRLDKALRAALPQPSDATANVEDPHASTGSFVAAHSRHAAPSAASAQPARTR
jgi:hypothetical protein